MRPATVNVGAVACPSVTTCYAVGNNIVGSTDAGMTWHEQSDAPGTQTLDAIACPSTTTCYAVGGEEIFVTTDAGQRWSEETAPTGTDPLSGIACSSATTCVAVGNVLDCLLGENDPCPPGPFPVISTTDGGASWTGHPLAADVNPISIACPSASTCELVALPRAGDRIRDGGDGRHSAEHRPRRQLEYADGPGGVR